MNKVVLKTGIFAITGALLGFLYYKFIGCHSGTCAITSNPWISTAYGMIFGILLGYPSDKKSGNLKEGEINEINQK